MLNLLTEEEVARQLHVSLAALRRWRLEGRGPRFIKVSALVRYRPEELEQWLASRPAGGTTDQAVRGRVPVTAGYRSARA
jgi:predicted DNA-binding transcriptional regulator AlpA